MSEAQAAGEQVETARLARWQRWVAIIVGCITILAALGGSLLWLGGQVFVARRAAAQVVLVEGAKHFEPTGAAEKATDKERTARKELQGEVRQLQLQVTQGLSAIGATLRAQAETLGEIRQDLRALRRRRR